MSVINQMLQELELRRSDASISAAQVRAVAGRRRPRWVLWILPALGAAAIFVALGYWIPRQQATVVPASLPVTALAPPPAALPVTPQLVEEAPQAFQLASELGPLPAQAAKPSSPPVKTPLLPAPVVEAAVEKPKPAAKHEPAPRVAIDREIKQTSPQQRAENAYRQAYAGLQQGRMGEANDSLHLALQFDPRHVASRQALAALLVEGKQLGRAEQLLHQGLELLPGHPEFAMTLARLQVERGDVVAALASLQRNPPSEENADYRGFLAALLQRSARHKEAIEEYQLALRSKPDAGPWLLGLGISLQADNQSARAAEVFRRAKSSATLSPELQAFAEQRLKQVQ